MRIRLQFCHACCLRAVHPLIVLGVWGQLVEAHLIPGEALRKADLQEGVRYQTAQPGAYLTARTVPKATCVALGMYIDRILLLLWSPLESCIYCMNISTKYHAT